MNKLLVALGVMAVLLLEAGGWYFVSTTRSDRQNNCGDGICDSIERNDGLCSQDCDGVPVQATDNSKNTVSVPVNAGNVVALAPTAAISVVSPNGGETLTKGSNTNIRWSGGVYPVQVGIVRATYPADTTVVGWITVGANDGTFVWDTYRIGPLDYSTSNRRWQIDPGQYKILVVSRSADGSRCFGGVGCVYDVSDAPFTITTATPF